MDRAVEDLRVRYGGGGLSGPAALGDADSDPSLAAGAEAPEPPRLFVRVIVTRPSLPWDQAGAARLEARLNAPLPLDQVTFLLKRLDLWRPGAPGRYAAVYARHDAVRGGYAGVADVEGRALAVRFPSPERRSQQARQIAIIAAATGLATFLLIASAAAVLTTRAEAESRLQTLEASAQRRLRDARRLDLLRGQMQALQAADLDSRRAGRVLEDMDWAAAAKAPDARIEAFFREGDLMAVEVRGDGEPFAAAARKVQRSARSIRGGVWLWGVSPAGAVAAETTP